MKAHLVIVGPFGPLSKVVQAELQKRGAQWGYSPVNELFDHSFTAIFTRRTDDAWRLYCGEADDDRRLPTFDLTTEPITRWLEFLDAPEPPKWPQNIDLSLGMRAEVHEQGFVYFFPPRQAISSEQLDAIHAASMAAREGK